MSAVWGVMQGRFTDKGAFRPQEFPWDHWREEFSIAREHQIDCIEWMLNAERLKENPICSPAGRREIRDLVRNNGVHIRSVCLNCLMAHCIETAVTDDFLRCLRDAVDELDIWNVIIPLFEASGISDTKGIAGILKKWFCVFGGRRVNILIESDLPIRSQISVCRMLSDPRAGICYDTGNAAGNGYDCVEEILAARDYLKEVHLKDKPLNGTSTMLGSGTADFRGVFDALRQKDRMVYIFESYFGENAVEDTRKNIQYIRGVYE